VQPFEGVRDLFEALKSLGMKIGIATTCQKDELAAYDRLLHILELTDAVVCGEMVKHGKPDPALVRTCLTQLSCSNGSRALMVGDTPYDAQAASPLGVLPAGLLTGGFSATDLRKAGCCAVFPQVKDLGALWNHIATPVLRTAS
jgi:phosphoglycolate phosphatase-like HAD superfamily hydrolase